MAAPTVQLLTPASGQRPSAQSPLAVSWATSDPDGDSQNAYAIGRAAVGQPNQWWNGASWIPLPDGGDADSVSIAGSAMSAVLPAGWAYGSGQVVIFVQARTGVGDARDWSFPNSAYLSPDRTILSQLIVNSANAPRVTLSWTLGSGIVQTSYEAFWWPTAAPAFSGTALNPAWLGTSGRIFSTSARAHTFDFVPPGAAAFYVRVWGADIDAAPQTLSRPAVVASPAGAAALTAITAQHRVNPQLQVVAPNDLDVWGWSNWARVTLPGGWVPQTSPPVPVLRKRRSDGDQGGEFGTWFVDGPSGYEVNAVNVWDVWAVDPYPASEEAYDYQIRVVAQHATQGRRVLYTPWTA